MQEKIDNIVVYCKKCEETYQDHLTLQLLKDRNRAKFQRIQKDKQKTGKSIASTVRSFKGMCDVCKTIDQKGMDCFMLKN
jgi:hypothetical protein